MERYPAIYVPATDVLIGLPRSSYDRFVAGRDAGANLSLQDPAWGQEQFSIKVDSRGTVLEPISETTPTLVNEGPVAGPRILQHGDKISAGATSFVFLGRAPPPFPKPPAPTPPPPLPSPPT